MDTFDCSVGLDSSRLEPMDVLCVKSCDRNTILYDSLTMETLSREGQFRLHAFEG